MSINKQEQKFADANFTLNAKGYIEFNKKLIIDNRYKVTAEIEIDKDLGTTAKGRYGSVFRVKDLKDGQIKALKINRIPPADEDQKRQAAKEQLKKQQQMKMRMRMKQQQQQQQEEEEEEEEEKQEDNNNNKNKNNHLQQRRTKTVKERYKSSCKREIGVLKRVTRKNQNGIIPCLILYDYGEYLGHTYMIFPLYDLPLQQHLTNVQKYQGEVIKSMDNSKNPPNTAPNNALIHPDDLWAFQEQLISALSYIHNICNVMHLDFKPKNIMINKYGYDIIKYAKNLHLLKLKCSAITLIDFSVSAKAPKKANLDEVRYTGNFGTRRYRPSEMIFGGKWNRSVDTYGTAMIILESIKLYPIIDTTYYKKKKVLKYKKKLKKIKQDPSLQSHENNIINKKYNYKQLDINEVLYLIIQQIGFPDIQYWNKLDENEKRLFPQYPLIENISRKGKKSKLFDNDGYDNIMVKKKMEEMKNIDIDDDDIHNINNINNINNIHNIDLELSWNLFSDKLKNHKGTVWNLFKLYGSHLYDKSKLNIMEQSLKKMVVWDPSKRITPEQVLKEYFPKNIMLQSNNNTVTNNNNNNNNINDDDD